MKLLDELQRAYPHGHPAFAAMTFLELELHSNKNHDYALGGDPLGNFKRVGAILALYPGLRLDQPQVVALVYLLKQLDATLWGMAKGITHKVEGLDGRLADVSVYAKLVRCLLIDSATPPPSSDTPHK